MPVRDLDAFLPIHKRPLRILGNRGASGIDGVVSTGLGVAGAGVGRTVILLGDVSLYHDLNGLLAAKRFSIDATIVVVNNDGAGIFSLLPQATVADDDRVMTSSRRWEKEGVIYCTLRNWILQGLYFLGVPPHKLANFYKSSDSKRRIQI